MLELAFTEQRTCRADWQDLSLLLDGLLRLHYCDWGLFSYGFWLGVYDWHSSCWLLLSQLSELVRISKSIEKLEKELKLSDKYKVCHTKQFPTFDFIFYFQFYLDHHLNVYRMRYTVTRSNSQMRGCWLLWRLPWT